MEFNFKDGTTLVSKNTFKIIGSKPLGTGNYSVVYHAYHVELGRQVAMKFFKGGRQSLEILKGEAWIQGRLNHPNIVSIFGSDEEQGMLITEYLPKTLDKFLKSGKESPDTETSLKIFAECVRALDHAYTKGVVHGDIKPANILLTNDNSAKVNDFGVSKLMGALPKAHEGSANWASPEVLEVWNQKHEWAPDYADDLFSLGVVAYLMFTKKHPFQDPSARYTVQEMILRTIQNGFIPNLPEKENDAIPKKVSEIIMNLLREKKTRYREPSRVLADLGEYYETTPLNAGLGELPANVNESVRKIVEGYNSLEHIQDKNKVFIDFITSQIVHLGALADLWKAGRVQVEAAEIESKGITIFQNLKSGGFCTRLVRLNDFWETTARYHQVCREIAQRGKKIARVFICEDVQTIDKIDLLKHISADENASIETSIAFSKDITDRNAVKDFGIWDTKEGDVLCVVEKETLGGGAIGCYFTDSKSSLDDARDWKKTIMNESKPSREVLLQRVSDLTNANRNLLILSRSAPIMRKLALKSCKGSYFGEGSCRWYHESWQYLRLLDLVSTPDWHGDFYTRNISRLVTGKREISILICGVADYGMLSHVVSGCTNMRGKPKILVVDLCQTPLEICKWYCDNYARDLHIETMQGDATKGMFGQNSYDLIVTDAFLTRFDKADKRRVVDNWRKSLKTDGAILTTVRIDNNGAEGPRRATLGQIESFKEKAWNTAIERSGLVISEIADERIKKMAGEYARRIASYSFNGEEDVKQLFNEFSLSVDIVNTKGEFQLTRYAQIVARR